VVTQKNGHAFWKKSEEGAIAGLQKHDFSRNSSKKKGKERASNAQSSWKARQEYLKTHTKTEFFGAETKKGKKEGKNVV